MNRKWIKMGVEMEGGWDDHYERIANKVRHAQGKHDGSVKVSGCSYNGEITTRPHSSLDPLCEEIAILHPAYVNNTCGFHIHTSFSELDYSLLATSEFYSYFKSRWREWGESMATVFTRDERERFWDRLDSKSDHARRYCKDVFEPEAQLLDPQRRYTILNFAAYSKFKTLECRFLPMFKNSEVTIAAVRVLSDIYDTFLNTAKFPDIKFFREVKEQGDMVVEEHTITLPDTTLWEEAYPRVGKDLVVGADVFYHIPGAEGEMLPFVEDNDG